MSARHDAAAVGRAPESLFLWHGLRLSTMAVACGLVSAAALTRLMKSLLIETSPLARGDPSEASMLF
jgi:hypothetical protein